MIKNFYIFVKDYLGLEFGDSVITTLSTCGEVTVLVKKTDVFKVCNFLRESNSLLFEQLIDLCGVDYLYYGVDDRVLDECTYLNLKEEFHNRKCNFKVLSRFAVVYNLLSVSLNYRLRIRTFVGTDAPFVSSVSSIWSVAEWYEREAFDLFGIEFIGHRNLCRILTDYGFRDFPLRKDFPVVGKSVVFYSNECKKILYTQNTVEERRLIPKVIRFSAKNF